MRIPDNYDLWEAHDREQARREARLPVCEQCRERINDDFYWDIDGDILCGDCAATRHRKYTEDYIEID